MEHRPPFPPPEEETPFLRNPLVLGGLGLVAVLLVAAVAVVLLTPGDGGGDGASASNPRRTPTAVGTPADGTPTEGVLARILDVVDVRAGPGERYPFLGTLRSGAPVRVTGRNDDGTWVQIVFPPGSLQRGWIQASAVEIQGDLASVPIATPEALELPEVPTPAFSETETVTPEATEAAETVTPTPAETPVIEGEPADVVVGIPVSVISGQVVVTAINQGSGEYRGSLSVDIYDATGETLLASSSAGIVALGPGARIDVPVPFTFGPEPQQVVVVIVTDQPETDLSNNSATFTLPPQ
ncbi:MAG TPA: SH3 domain-containing protein [Dehalococcoidia bacterium]|nr:SH3 domain-containing protein [Dehalococcoidia bacterium]